MYRTYCWKYFSNYQNPIDLFMNSRVVKISPKKVLKDQINFKLGLCKIIKGKKIKSNDK